ncbi:MAG: Spy0128 family protein [Bacillota bacterium]
MIMRKRTLQIDKKVKLRRVLLAMVMTVFLTVPAAALAMPVSLPYQQTFTNNSSEASVADTFDYQITAADASSPMPEGSSNGAYVFSLKGNTSGSLNLDIPFKKPGYYHYTVKSKVDKPKKGYTYSSKTYTVMIMVVNGSDGLETGAITIKDAKSTKYDRLVFKTKYHKKRPGGGGNDGGGSGSDGSNDEGITPPEVPLEDAGNTEDVTDGNQDSIIGNVNPTEGEDYWALINLICMLLTWLTAILGAVLYVIRRRQAPDDIEEAIAESEEFEDPQKLRRKGYLRGGAVVVAIISLILFLLTEDMTLPMRMVDEWTIWMVILLAAALVLALTSRKVTIEPDNTEGEG